MSYNGERLGTVEKVEEGFSFTPYQRWKSVTAPRMAVSRCSTRLKIFPPLTYPSRKRSALPPVHLLGVDAAGRDLGQDVQDRLGIGAVLAEDFSVRGVDMGRAFQLANFPVESQQIVGQQLVERAEFRVDLRVQRVDPVHVSASRPAARSPSGRGLKSRSPNPRDSRTQALPSQQNEFSLVFQLLCISGRGTTRAAACQPPH